jgi:hypothetical protein
MRSNILMAALAGAALIATGPALSQGRGGGHGNGIGVGVGVSTGARINHGNHGARVDTQLRTDGRIRRDEARVRSRAPLRASARARTRANANSVIYGTSVGAAAALRSGMLVRDTNGVTIGTVSRVNVDGDGRIRNVLVRSADRTRTIPLSPTVLSVSGDVVTSTRLATSQRRNR